LPTLQELARALQETEAWLHAVVSNAPIVLFATDADGVFVLSEGKGREALGLAPGEGVGLSVYDLFADFPVVIANINRALAGETFTDVVEIGELAFDTWYAPWRNGAGEVRGTMAVATDVTETRKVQAALERSQARTRALLESTPDVIAVVEPDGRLRYASPAAARVLGCAPDGELPSIFDLVHADDLTAVLQASQAAMDGDPRTVEFRLRHADGSWRWFEAVGNDMRHDPDIEGVVVTAHDITARKETEEAYRAEGTRFGAMLQHLSDMIVVVDKRGNLQWASPSARDFVGDETSYVHLVHPDDIAVAIETYTDLLATPGAVRRFECRMRRGTSWRHVDTIATNLLHDPAVRGIVCNARDMTDSKQAQAELDRQAYHDVLTGLPNRALFLDRLEMALSRAKRRHTNVAVLFLDLDRFKVINDSLGHEPGDRLLAAVARRLEGALRPEDTVARFGGDEFTVLCEDMGADLEPVGIAERISRALATPFTLDDREVFLSASIGIAVAPTEQARADVLLRDADAAMYRAKERGRARVEVFDEATRARAMERMETEHDLHRAIDRGELCLMYQPIIDLLTGRVIGVEALIRWQHPQRGLVEPGGFIPLAEETGLIVPIGEWAVAEACRQVATWRSHGVLPDSFSVAVNLSAGQLAQPRLRQVLDAALFESSLDPASVWLEITESALLVDADAAIATLRGFKERGLRMSIDDFGTGYSSLSYLKRLPIDALKVDRSFVSGLVSDTEDHAIAEAVVALAHTLGLRAVAEGVETIEQLAEVRRIGCDGAQGFLFSRAVSPDAVEALLRDRPSW
jgi:diguanylate cyclase (GGDEF)-like protein/PAS domain S-box-containing protein